MPPDDETFLFSSPSNQSERRARNPLRAVRQKAIAREAGIIKEIQYGASDYEQFLRIR
jgi:hypothetical protein